MGQGAPSPSPAHDVADDVGVADEDLVTVLLLLGVCPVDVVPEGGLDPGSIFVILLGAGQGTLSMEGACRPRVEGYGESGATGGAVGDTPRGSGGFYHSLWLPVGHGWVGLDGGTFSQQVCADLANTCGRSSDSVAAP